MSILLTLPSLTKPFQSSGIFLKHFLTVLTQVTLTTIIRKVKHCYESSIYRWGSWGTEKLNNFHEDHTTDCSAGIWTQAIWLWVHIVIHYTPVQLELLELLLDHGITKFIFHLLDKFVTGGLRSSIGVEIAPAWKFTVWCSWVHVPWGDLV